MRASRNPATNVLQNIPRLMERVVGLDLSLTSTGLADLRMATFAAQTLKSRYRGVDRLIDLGGKLTDWLCTGPPVAAAIEGYSFGSRANQHSTGEWGGVAKTKLRHACVPTIIVPPATLKKFITGKGNADPSSIPMFLLKHWNIEVPQNDMADAVGLAIMALAWKFPEQVDLKLYQREALEKVEVMT